MSEEINQIEEEISAEKAVDAVVEEGEKQFSAPLLRDENGRFIKGTGAGLHGGRPKGARDRITTKLIDLATALINDRGEELLEEVARNDPATALAIALKLVPNSELVLAHTEERSGRKDGEPMKIEINMVSALPAASDSRVERLEHGDLSTQHIIEHAAEQAAREPVEQCWDEVSREDLEYEAEQ